jgi:hypothetical protein
MSHKSPASLIVAAIGGLLMVAALTPALIALSSALVPLVLVVAIAAAVLRLVWFHTRRW